MLGKRMTSLRHSRRSMGGLRPPALALRARGNPLLSTTSCSGPGPAGTRHASPLRGARCALWHATCGAAPCTKTPSRPSSPHKSPCSARGACGGMTRRSRSRFFMFHTHPTPNPRPAGGGHRPPRPRRGSEETRARGCTFQPPAHGPQHQRTAMPHLHTARITTDSHFQDLLDGVDPHVCSQDELQQLINDAPDLYTLGYLAGIYNHRQMLQILTYRAF